MHTLLVPYLGAVDRVSEDAHLHELLQTHAFPLIRRVVVARLAGLEQDVEDVCSEAHLELLLWLRRLKANPDLIKIDDFPAYTSAIAVVPDRAQHQDDPTRSDHDAGEPVPQLALQDLAGRGPR